MIGGFFHETNEMFTYESVKHLLFIWPRQIEQFGGGEPVSLWLSSPSISLSEIAMSVINCFWMKSRIRVFVFIGGVGQLFTCSGVGGQFNVSSDIVACTNILLENFSHTKSMMKMSLFLLNRKWS